jgi:hypothetical protein
LLDNVNIESDIQRPVAVKVLSHYRMGVNMRKILQILVLSVLFCLLMTVIPACTTTVTSTQSVPASSSQPPVTVTMISTTAVTKTVTASPSTPSTTSSPTVAPTTPVKAPEYASNNNSHFFMYTYLNTNTPIRNPDGTISDIPVKTDFYSDLDLGGFFTDQDAIQIRQVPSVTSRDDYVYMFSFPAYDLPFTINLGYKTISDNPETTLECFVLNKGNFKSTYEKSPFEIYRYNLAKDGIRSTQGIYCYKISSAGDLVAVIRTNNASNISYWWMKYGGKHYSE